MIFMAHAAAMVVSLNISIPSWQIIRLDAIAPICQTINSSQFSPTVDTHESQVLMLGGTGDR